MQNIENIAEFNFSVAANGDVGIAEVKLESGEEREFMIGFGHDSVRACDCASEVEYELDFAGNNQSIEWYRSISREEAARAAVENWLEVDLMMRAA